MEVKFNMDFLNGILDANKRNISKTAREIDVNRRTIQRILHGTDDAVFSRILISKVVKAYDRRGYAKSDIPNAYLIIE